MKERTTFLAIIVSANDYVDAIGNLGAGVSSGRGLPKELRPDILGARAVPYCPSRKWPNAFNGRTRSQTIFTMASIGTARIAPGTPHIQNQNTSARMTSTGLSVKRRARSMG